MQYIVIEIQENTESIVATQNFIYHDRNTAEQKYHEILMYAAASALPSHAAVMLTSDGREVKHETYVHVQPEPEPEPDEEEEPEE